MSSATTPTPAADTAPRFLPVGDAALAVEFGDRIHPVTNARVIALAEALRHAPVEGVTETVPTFRSLLIHYDPLRCDHAELTGRLHLLLAGLHLRVQPGRRVTIPACYEGDLAPDLAEVAALTGLTAEQVVRLHAATEYQVYMLGFLPGFPYMGLLPEELRLPRLTTPRVHVPPRALAIANAMTAIYPLASPGGWRLIGTVPVELFAIDADPPARLRPGDHVRFQPVDRGSFETMRAVWRAGEGRLGIVEQTA